MSYIGVLINSHSFIYKLTENNLRRPTVLNVVKKLPVLYTTVDYFPMMIRHQDVVWLDYREFDMVGFTYD